ncbi:MAG: winged helix-turn-helix transcriptional regulator [Candidatus Bathyarchaeia archaeon]
MLKRNVIISLGLVAIALSFAFLAIANQQLGDLSQSTIQDVDGTRQILFSSSIVIGASLNENPPLLNQPARMKIYNLVKNSPGIHFRAICNSLNMPIGLVQYHLNLLTTAGLISVYYDGMYKRYFVSKIFSESDMGMISLLKHTTLRGILTFLSREGSIFHKDLASRLSLSSQALSLQMSRLKDMGLVNWTKEGMKIKYSLNPEKETVLKRCLSFGYF